VLLTRKIPAIYGGGVGQNNPYLRRQLSQKKLDEKEVRPVLPQKTQHPVIVGWLAWHRKAQRFSAGGL